MQRFYRKTAERFEYCFNVESSSPLTAEELKTLRWLLAETFEQDSFGEKPFLTGKRVVEIGPRLNFETAFSTNAVAICHACGLDKITRIERSRRLAMPPGSEEAQFIADSHDRMTECLYPQPLSTFETNALPKPVYTVPLIEKGVEELKRANREMGLGMDDWDINFYYGLFTNTMRRNPTNVELFLLGNNNSEHSRHWFFKGKLVIDGKAVPETLFQIVKDTLQANPFNSVIAFSDNSSAIKGYKVWTIIPERPGNCSPLFLQQRIYHFLFTAETHCFPTGKAPFRGAETGTGGRIRDDQTTGKGSLVIAGTAGYCTGNLLIANYSIPGEVWGVPYPPDLASPLQILIGASNGASDYGNKFGEPVIQGFVRTFGLTLPSSERREWLKPIMFTGGIGQIDHKHIRKEEPEKGMLIIQVGGPAYRIGVGGGSASSMIHGQNSAELDFNAVQRGNAQMENKLNRVIRACVEMGKRNPILAAHDQGAGGPGNVLEEIVSPAGGTIKIREITVGDKTMSVLEILCGEYQERDAFLIKPDRVNEFQTICRREKVNCEILGEISDDGRFVVYDSRDDSTPVDLGLAQVLGEVPQKTFTLERLPRKLMPLNLLQNLQNLSIEEVLCLVFRLPSVGSKGYLVRKVDRSVTGLIAQQQCCGPLQLPVSDVAVVAQSHFGLTGGAMAIGEQPIKMLVDPKAGARMAVAEMLTNIASAKISDLSHIKCSANWMWPAKLPGEGALLYDAAVAAKELMVELGIAIDGGKDSLSMAAKVGNDTVKAPGQLAISGYASMPNITQKVTPDIKKPGGSTLALIDLGCGKNRLGGSALAQAFWQIGDKSPDVESPLRLAVAFKVIQALIEQGLILACHDRSDGGLITTLAEMAMAGNCGITIQLDEKQKALPQLFSEELGWVIEYLPEREKTIEAIFWKSSLPFRVLGSSRRERRVLIRQGDNAILDIDIPTLLKWWEATSDRLEQEQMNPQLAEEQAGRHDRSGPVYRLTFQLQSLFLPRRAKPKVAIIREEGSNGDREMASAFKVAEFEPWDVAMSALLERNTNFLDQFKGVAFVGGFSYGDVFDSAKGWAGTIKFNSKLRNTFERFYSRSDTFSLGVCNGCQLMALLGWVPWKGIAETKQPRFIRNLSERFESRWSTVKILPSPAIMLKDMVDSSLGIWVAHGEGRFFCPDNSIYRQIEDQGLAPIRFVDDKGIITEDYPLNPNGSTHGIAALGSPDGRHLAVMPHPERTFLRWQNPYWPEEWQYSKVSPWLKLFLNAREWVEGR